MTVMFLPCSTVWGLLFFLEFEPGERSFLLLGFLVAQAFVGIAIAVTIAAAIDGLLLIFDIVEDDAHIGESLLFVETLNVEEQAFVEFAGTNHEAGVVGHVFDDVGVNDHASRSAVNDDVIVTGTELVDHLVEAG